MRKTYGKKLLGALAVGTLAFAAVTSQAATVILDPTDNTNATGINGLEVAGSTYDVTFLSNTTANALYGPLPPGTFPFDGVTAANVASDAVVAALNSVPSVVTVGEEGAVGDLEWHIGWDINISGEKISNARGTYSTFNNNNNWIPTEGNEPISFGAITTYADFHLSEVPVPAAAWLFGSALLGLGALKRKKA